MSLRDLLPDWVDDLEPGTITKTLLVAGGMLLFILVRRSLLGPVPGWVGITVGALMVLVALIWIIKDRADL